MSTPHASEVDPSARSQIDLEQLDQLDSDEIEKIEAQLSTGTPPPVLQEQLVEAFLR